MSPYRLLYSKTARRLISKLNPEIKPIVRSRLDKLKKDPFLGKRLQRELSGYRSLRTGRYRIVYKVDEEEKNIQIHYVGHRRDVYELISERGKE